MLRNLLTRFVSWARHYQQKRRMRQRVALLEQRLAGLDSDISSMAHFPAHLVQRMVKYRERLVAQLELAKKLAQ